MAKKRDQNAPISPSDVSEGASAKMARLRQEAYDEAATWADGHNTATLQTTAWVGNGRGGRPRLWAFSPDHPISFETPVESEAPDAP